MLLAQKTNSDIQKNCSTINERKTERHAKNPLSEI